MRAVTVTTQWTPECRGPKDDRGPKLGADRYSSHLIEPRRGGRLHPKQSNDRGRPPTSTDFACWAQMDL